MPYVSTAPSGITLPALVTVLFFDARVDKRWMLAHSSSVVSSPAERLVLVELDLGVRGHHRLVVETDDEGVTWVRGHVHESDPEGAALLSAHAMREAVPHA